MDIEWAYEGDQLFLLQARPITTYYKLPEEMISQTWGAKEYLPRCPSHRTRFARKLKSPRRMDMFLSVGRLIAPGSA